MASLPLETIAAEIAQPLASGSDGVPAAKRRRYGWWQLLVGGGPCWYRLIRFGQRRRD